MTNANAIATYWDAAQEFVTFEDSIAGQPNPHEDRVLVSLHAEMITLLRSVNEVSYNDACALNRTHIADTREMLSL